MKPPVFDYHDPATVEEALDLLAVHGDDGKVLAGGQSLVPLLNFRLAHPEHLIDVNNIGELSGIKREGGRLRIGALTRQSMLERSALVADNWPLLTEALSFVAHAQIRNRGTVGGSVAHADPAAELPVAFLASDADFIVKSKRGERTIPATDFFVTHLTTTMEPDELMVAIEVPAPPEGAGYAFTEFARRHGDFALGGAAVLLAAEGRTCTAAAVGLLAAAPTPLRAAGAEEALIGSELSQDGAEAAAKRAVEGIDPTGDIHGSSEYRRGLIEVMVRRAIEKAAGRLDGDALGFSRNGGGGR
ncbi:MAG TPA: xanthine dehydrogenase family protein subunit M [Solirubrobacterales bacterium]|nr:xanthine dehydrogenase family protein subunit M [Solirubrobacterales bacterium]